MKGLNLIFESWDKPNKSKKQQMTKGLDLQIPKGLDVYTNGNGNSLLGGRLNVRGDTNSPVIQQALADQRRDYDRRMANAVKSKQRSLGGLPDLGGARLRGDEQVEKINPDTVSTGNIANALNEEGSKKWNSLADSSQNLLSKMYSNSPQASSQIQQINENQKLLAQSAKQQAQSQDNKKETE